MPAPSEISSSSAEAQNFSAAQAQKEFLRDVKDSRAEEKKSPAEKNSRNLEDAFDKASTKGKEESTTLWESRLQEFWLAHEEEFSDSLEDKETLPFVISAVSDLLTKREEADSIVEMGVAFLEKNLPKLEKLVEGSEDQEVRANALKGITLLFRGKKAGEREIYLPLIEKHQETLIRGLKDNLFNKKWVPALADLVSVTEEDPRVDRMVNEILDEVIEAKERTGLIGAINLSVLIRNLGNEARGEGLAKLKRISTKILSDFNLPSHLYESWERNFPGGIWSSSAANIATLVRMETAESGSAAVLNQEFGIENFGRYPSELLVDQYKNRNDNELPYGVILFPLTDKNGTFFTRSVMFQELFEDLKGKYRLRVVEADGRMGVARHLINLDRRYGDKNKISFALIGAHGNVDNMKFGENPTDDSARNRLTVRDLKGKGASRLSEFFEPEPTIVLSSCFTGAKKAIGQELNELIGGRLLAPDTADSLESLGASFDQGGKLLLSAAFAKGSGQEFTKKLK